MKKKLYTFSLVVVLLLGLFFLLNKLSREQREQFYRKTISEITTALESNDWDTLEEFDVYSLEGRLLYGFADVDSEHSQHDELVIVEEFLGKDPWIDRERYSIKKVFSGAKEVSHRDFDFSDIEFTAFPTPQYETVSVDELLHSDFSSIEGEWWNKKFTLAFTEEGLKRINNIDVTDDDYKQIGIFTINTKIEGTLAELKNSYIDLRISNLKIGDFGSRVLRLIPKGASYNGVTIHYDRIIPIINGKETQTVYYRKEDYYKVNEVKGEVWNEEKSKQLEEFMSSYKGEKYLDGLKKVDLSTTPLEFDEFYDVHGLLGTRAGNYRAPHTYFDSSMSEAITMSYSADGKSESDVTVVEVYKFDNGWSGEKFYYFTITRDGVPNVYRLSGEMDGNITLSGMTWWEVNDKEIPSRPRQVASDTDYQGEFYNYFKEVVNGQK